MAPLTALAGLAALVLVFCVVALVDHVKRLIRAHGLIRLIVRYLSGQHHTGMPQSDATWSTPGTRALTQTGHCRAFWLKPRRERAKIRCTRAASVAGSCFGLAEMRLATLTLLGCSRCTASTGCTAQSSTAVRRPRTTAIWCSRCTMPCTRCAASQPACPPETGSRWSPTGPGSSCGSRLAPRSPTGTWTGW